MVDVDDLLHRMNRLEQEQQRVVEALEVAEEERQAAETARDQYHGLYLEMLERCRKLERGLIGQKAEKLPENEQQLTLAILQAALGEANSEELDDDTDVKAHRRRSNHGRKPIPEHLPRVEIEVVPLEVQQRGLDQFKVIGQDVTEVVERRPASLVVVHIIKPKFVAKQREKGEPSKILVGMTPALPIARCLAGPGMLADTIVRRWQDHLPLHRLEGIYAREGMPLARSTVCGWHDQLTPLVEPLVAAMRQDALEQPYLCTDATGVLVQAKEKCRTGHFWVLVAPERHVLFEFSKHHDSDAVDELLAGYSGYLVADAHVVYDHLYHDGSIQEVNCWAHYLESVVIQRLSWIASLCCTVPPAGLQITTTMRRLLIAMRGTRGDPTSGAIGSLAFV